MDAAADQPDWSTRIIAARANRSWTQQDLVDALRAVSDADLPADESMLRSIKGWEAGDHRPSHRYRKLLAAVLGSASATPLASNPGDIPDIDGAESLDVLERLAASELNGTTLDLIEQHVEQLCTEYSWADPHQTLSRSVSWLRYLDDARSGRTTVTEHIRIIELAGWLTLLVATLSFDLADRPSAERARRVAVRFGQEAGNPEIRAWALELLGWFNLALGHWERVIPTAQAGQLIAGERGIGAQLAVQEAEGFARIGERRQADAALGRAQALLERLPAPPNPLHHFCVAYDKFDKAVMHIHVLQGHDDEAVAISADLEARFSQTDGTFTKPMRVADARGVRAVAAARDGAIDEALALAHSAFDIERQTLPSLVKNTIELADVLTTTYPDHPGSRDLLARRAELATVAAQPSPFGPPGTGKL
ncbi:MAG: hypothetical protein AAF467_28300 [Actinomycetota bacterium]